MKLDGQLEGAQLEELSSDAPTPAARSRLYSDIQDTANPIPRFYDSSKFVPLKLRKLQYGSLSAIATASKTKEAYLCDASGGAFTVTLPPAADMPYQELFIKKTDATFSAVTLDGNASEQIDGANTILLCTKGEWVRLLSLSTSWTVLESGYYMGKTAYTPTGAWIANSTYTAYWWRTGNRINIDFLISLAGAPTSAALYVNLPTGVSVDTTNRTIAVAGATPFAGNITCIDASTENYSAMPYFNDANSFAVKKDDGDGTISNVTQTAPFTFGNGDAVQGVVLDIVATNWRG